LFQKKITPMKLFNQWPLAASLLLLSMAACNSNENTKTSTKEMPVKQIKEERISYTLDSLTMNAVVAYDAASDEKRPVILIVHEWWGLNDYAISRAKQLASLGYLAMAIDMYGNGQQADNPEQAGKLATPFYQQPAMAKARFDAALAKVKTLAQADTNQIAAIGYCFGGAQVLNMARLGSPLKGVVSFHGNLVGVPADKNNLKARVLVCHGDADPFVPATEVTQFKKQMDSIGADYSFKSYAGATHAFTNPNATAMGKKFSIPIAYSAAADSASWNDMKVFFNQIFK
jgi:dienelactone hydrolase